MTDWQTITDMDELLCVLWQRKGYRVEQREQRAPDYKGKRHQAFPYWIIIDPDGNETAALSASDEAAAWRYFRLHVYPFTLSIHDMLKWWGTDGGNVVMESAGHDHQWFVYVSDDQYPSERIFAEITTLDKLAFTLIRARIAYLDHVAQLAVRS